MRVGPLLQASFPENIEHLASWSGMVLELVGIAVIMLGAVASAIRAVLHAVTDRTFRGTFEMFRRSLGHAILLGLEFLVAADIIGTVLIDPTLENLSVLAILIGLRTFLSIALTVEIEHRWPWQAPNHDEHVP